MKKITIIKGVIPSFIIISLFFTTAVSAQENTDILNFSDNSITTIELLQSNISNNPENEIISQPENVTSTQNDITIVDVSMPVEATTTTAEGPDSTAQIDTDAVTQEDLIAPRNPITLEDASEDASTTSFWQEIENTSSTTPRQDGPVLSTLRFWFNQFFSFRNTESNPSVLHINDMHAVTNKSSAWIGWKTNNLSTSRIYYSTTTPVEVETSMIAATPQGETSITIKSLLEDTKYYYRVLAEDAYGNNAVSGELSFTTK